jgi:hypothetical protein
MTAPAVDDCSFIGKVIAPASPHISDVRVADVARKDEVEIGRAGAVRCRREVDIHGGVYGNNGPKRRAE